jgi:outer membrane protein assembly factor BamB
MKLDRSSPPAPLRLWPGVLIAAVVVLARYVVPLFVPDATAIGMLVAAAGLLLLVVWWLFLSRAPWLDRVAAVVLIALAMAATFPLLHESIATGMMGLMFFIYAIPPVLTVAFVAWAVAARRLPARLRIATMAAVIFAACGVWTLARTDGLLGDRAQLAWRWTPTAEQRLLARATDMPASAAPQAPAPEMPAEPVAAVEPVSDPTRPDPTPDAVPTAAPPPTPEAATPAWGGFRGPDRDGVVRGVRIATDWARTPPVELWRRPVGPGWSSFAVQGDLVYTQEQRGEEEIVAAYRLRTGEPVWSHRDSVRFYESNAGPGPRATPTLHEGRVYTLGATGLLNVLDAATGAVVWSRNAQVDTGAQLPDWGFAGSPLVLDDAVVVATSGRLAAYEIATGDLRWTRTTGGGGYSSPHLATVDGVPQILLLSGGGITSVAPADGATLWQQPGDNRAAGIVQPALAGGRDVLMAGSDMMGGTGIRRLSVARAGGNWTLEERWASRGLKPYFNDFVVHRGHAYGFDGSILSCIDLEDGARKWKGGRYGQGQVVLLADSDALLVLGEEGQLALVSATPDGYREIAQVRALDGKTWNHPVVVGDLLLIRNGEEMAAYRLPTSER